MPNHETNTVVIIGAPENIKRFVAEGLRDYQEGNNRWGDERPEKVIDFSLIVPEPENISHDGCSHFSDGHGPNGEFIDDSGAERICWYPWNSNHWGTKWGAYSHTHYALHFLKHWDTGEAYGRVELRFETAWSQPTPIFEAIESRWGLTVHAVTRDEGGYPDVEYGDPYGSDLIEKRVEHAFADLWEDAVSA